MASFAIPGAVEAEDLVAGARATSGGVWSQDMGNWDYGEAWSRRGALFWQADAPGAGLTVPVPAPGDGSYQVVARMVAGPASGIVRFSMGGKPLGGPVDLYSETWAPREVALGTAALRSGPNPVVVTVEGRNPLSRNDTVGIDAFILKPSQ
jgi:hypothetical protein